MPTHLLLAALLVLQTLPGSCAAPAAQPPNPIPPTPPPGQPGDPPELPDPDPGEPLPEEPAPEDPGDPDPDEPPSGDPPGEDEPDDPGPSDPGDPNVPTPEAPPDPCCFTNPGYAGICVVQPAEGETCTSILAYLNDTRSVGKTYCNHTEIRGGWRWVPCEGADPG